MGVLETALDVSLSGAVSGGLTRCLTQPLDVVKVRMQLQVEKISNLKGSKYTSLVQTITQIHAEEGLFALWKGHVPAQVLSILYGAVQFPAFESLKSIGITNHFLAGGLAGVTATIVCHPVDMMRTRLIAQGSSKLLYSGIIDGVKKLYVENGIRTYYKGLTPGCLLIFPQSAILFQMYDYLKFITPFSKSTEDLGHLFEGFIAGVAAKGAVYPLDLIKKRMQIQGFEDARRPFGQLHFCRGVCNCIWTVIRNEGIFALYKGFVPSLIKAGSVSALTFTFYEVGLRYARMGK